MVTDKPDLQPNKPVGEISLTERALATLHPIDALLARKGPYYDPHRIAIRAAMLGTDTVEALLSDPALVGCYVHDREMRDELIGLAGWLAETHPSAPQLRELSARYCVVKHFGNKTRVFFKQGGTWHHMSPAELKLAYANISMCVSRTKNGTSILKNVAEVWLKHPSTPYYEQAEFLPGQAAPPSVLNLWIEPSVRGHPFTDIPVDDMVWWRQWNAFPEILQYRVPKFAEHMLNNMCGSDMEVFEYLIGWMTDAIWNMGRTGDVAVVLRGPQGSGKGFWAKHFMEFFAPHTLTLNNPRQLVGNFNSHLQSVSMVFIDEAFFAGNLQQSNALKPLITDQEIFIEPKGVDGFMAPKRWRVIMASNEDHVVRAEQDARRFFVLEVDAGKHNDDGQYFSDLQQAWDEGEGENLFYWLTSPEAMVWLQRAWDVHDRPQTMALAKQKDLSLPPAQMIVHNILLEGEVPCDFASNPREGTVFVATHLLADSRRLSDRDMTGLGRALKAAAGASSVRHNVCGNRKRGFWLPPLELARQNWERFIGRTVEWPDDVVTWAVETIQSAEDDHDVF